MPWTSEHTKWFVKTSEELRTTDSKKIEVWEFQHQNDEGVLSAWAKHFRNHYCSDSKIDDWRKGTGYSRSDYLNNLKFPDAKVKPGPSIRSGDFGEILAADFLEYLLGYWVPRTRYIDKDIRNESTKGSDVIGFRIVKVDKFSPEDELAIFEAKTRFSQNSINPLLQNAVDDSIKDIIRMAESLNAIKQRKPEDSRRIERFQNPEDYPYKKIYGAIALLENTLFDKNLESSIVTNHHPYSAALVLVVIKGEQMMKLVHGLYKRAADEA